MKPVAASLPPPAPLSTTPSVRLRSGVTHRIKHGHPWVYRSELVPCAEEPGNGEIVIILCERGRSLGCGFYSAQSQIAVRRLSREPLPIDRAWLAQRLDAAIARRPSVPASSAQRLFWSESDGVPGWIVDRYGEVVVMQALTSGVDRLQPVLIELLQERLHPRAIILRNEAAVRRLEGLPLEVALAFGELPSPLHVEIHGITLPVDVMRGHKTGLYLDQIENHRLVAAHAKGKRVLDLFCHQGGFALHAARAGAVSCLAVDQAADALAHGSAVARAAGLSIEWVHANAFDWLKQAERGGQHYDLIVLDPPSFTKTKQQLDAALRGYHELHVRALRLLQEGGLLASFTCSHSITESHWREVLCNAASDVGCGLRLVQALTQSPDHPVLLHVPETEYLRGYLVERC